jgi:Arc/MetJ family transcription regulator
MGYAKISITLDPKVAAEVRVVAGLGGLSAFVNDAVRQKLQEARLRRMLDEMEVESGPIPQDMRDRVDALPWPD